MRIIHLESVDSTNDEVLRLAQAGEALPFWVIAKQQTKGRGRRGKQWHGLEGNIFASGIYDFATEPLKLATLSFVVSYSLFETLCQYIDKSKIALKWPNDILVSGKKISGILIEASRYSGAMRVVIGVGLNLAHAPEIAEYGTTSICDNLINNKAMPSRDEIFGDFIKNLAINMSLWAANGAGGIIESWKKSAFNLGQEIKIIHGNRNITGIFTDITPDGEMLLRLENGDIVKINAGEMLL